MTIHKLDTKIYVGQKAFINKRGKILVLRDPKAAIKGFIGLDFPGGKYRWGKDPKSELLREVKEETGLKIRIGRPFTVWITKGMPYLDPPANIFLIGYFCAYLSGKVKLSDEHNNYEWVDRKSYRKWKENSAYFMALEEYFRLK